MRYGIFYNGISYLFSNKYEYMAQIKRYCTLKEEHNGDNAFRVHRGYIFGNPYTHIKDKQTKALIKVKSREEAIERYKRYFEKCLEEIPEFKEEFEKMVDACMNYEEVWIGCYCNMNESCHADYIIKRLRQECTKRMVKNALKNKSNEVSLQKTDLPSSHQ